MFCPRNLCFHRSPNLIAHQSQHPCSSCRQVYKQRLPPLYALFSPYAYNNSLSNSIVIATGTVNPRWLTAQSTTFSCLPNPIYQGLVRSGGDIHVCHRVVSSLLYARLSLEVLLLLRTTSSTNLPSHNGTDHPVAVRQLPGLRHCVDLRQLPGFQQLPGFRQLPGFQHQSLTEGLYTGHFLLFLLSTLSCTGFLHVSFPSPLHTHLRSLIWGFFLRQPAAPTVGPTATKSTPSVCPLPFNGMQR